MISNKDGYIYFNELLFKACRMTYTEPTFYNKVIQEHELNTQIRIQKHAKKAQQKGKVDDSLTKATIASPLISLLFKKLTFRTLRTYIGIIIYIYIYINNS